MDCPGDTISYSCSITSNAESTQLIWSVTFPGNTPTAYIYNRTVMNSSVSVSTNHRSESEANYRNIYMQSTIILTILRNVSMNRAKLECNLAGVNNATEYNNAAEYILVNSAGEHYLWYILKAINVTNTFQST